MATTRDIGKKQPKMYRLNLTREEHKRFRVLAAEREMSMSELLTDIARKAIKRGGH